MIEITDSYVQGTFTKELPFTVKKGVGYMFVPNCKFSVSYLETEYLCFIERNGTVLKIKTYRNKIISTAFKELMMRVWNNVVLLMSLQCSPAREWKVLRNHYVEFKNASELKEVSEFAYIGLRKRFRIALPKFNQLVKAVELMQAINDLHATKLSDKVSLPPKCPTQKMIDDSQGDAAEVYNERLHQYNDESDTDWEINKCYPKYELRVSKNNKILSAMTLSSHSSRYITYVSNDITPEDELNGYEFFSVDKFLFEWIISNSKMRKITKPIIESLEPF